MGVGWEGRGNFVVVAVGTGSEGREGSENMEGWEDIVDAVCENDVNLRIFQYRRKADESAPVDSCFENEARSNVGLGDVGCCMLAAMERSVVVEAYSAEAKTEVEVPVVVRSSPGMLEGGHCAARFAEAVGSSDYLRNIRLLPL